MSGAEGLNRETAKKDSSDLPEAGSCSFKVLKAKFYRIRFWKLAGRILLRVVSLLVVPESLDYKLLESVKLFVGEEGEEPKAFNLDGGRGSEVFSVLSSQTARDIFLQLQEVSSTASDLADRMNSSVQNVSHHIENLKQVDLVEVKEKQYSPKGNEMEVYKAKEDVLVLLSGSEEEKESVKKALKGVLIFLISATGLGLIFNNLIGPNTPGKRSSNQALTVRETGGRTLLDRVLVNLAEFIDAFGNFAADRIFLILIAVILISSALAYYVYRLSMPE